MKTLFIAALVVLGLVVVSADLPIHCIRTQVAGTWEFELSEPTMTSPDLCGYRQPDKNKHHLDGTYTYVLKPHRTEKIELAIPNTVNAVFGNGTWTMVYDEGFWVSFPSMEFFAFHSYEPKKSHQNFKNIKPENYISYCDKTLVGWYHSNRKFGCWRGKQVKKAYPKLVFTGSSAPKHEVDYAVVSPTDLSPSFLESKYTPNYSFIEMHNKAEDKLWEATVYPEFLEMTNADMLKLAGGMKYKKDFFPAARPSPSLTPSEEALYTSFISASETAETTTETKRRESADTDAEADTDSEADADSEQEETEKEDKEPKCEFGLPCKLDWRNRYGQNWIPKIINQGRCGSCYAMAFMTVMEARLRIAKKDPNLPSYSPQHVVSCSVYNQGCDGGFPFLVGKHIEHFGAVSNKCFPYVASDSQCSNTCSSKPDYPITNTHYVGGYFGNNSEEAMMRELMKGPITVAFESPHSLFSYRGGIFSGPRPRVESQQVPGVRDWQHTNHAVVAVGWGHERRNGKRVKYWIMQNSWGQSWGENGYFRIIRGEDNCGIEGMSVTTTPV